MNLNRRALMAGVSALPLWTPWSSRAGTEIAALPRELKISLAVSPGGGPDTTARAISAFAQKRYGISMAMLNQAQVHGELALAKFLERPADGIAWLMCPNSVITTNPHIYPRASSDPLHGLQTVAQAGGNMFFMMVGASDPIQSLGDFVREAKSARNPMHYASGGAGSSHHLLMVDLAQRLGLQMSHIAYQGGTRAALGLASGDVRVAFGAAGALPLVKAGKLRILAVAEPQRAALFPTVPSLAEIAPGFSGSAWYGWFGREGIDPLLVAGMASLLRLAMADPDVRQTLSDNGGIEPTYLPGPALAERIRREAQHLGKIVALVPDLKP